jgi:hypothetical protein
VGLKDMFKKEVQCEKCGKVISKKQLAIFDTTIQGRNKSGQVIKVCKDCMMDLFYDSLRSNNSPAVVVHPIKKHNAYVFYNFDELLNIKQASSKEQNVSFVNDMQKLMPPKEIQCKCHSDKALYTWCSSEIFYNDPYKWEVNRDTKFEVAYLCKECLINEFQSMIREDNITFEVVYPPLGGEGFCTSWDI